MLSPHPRMNIVVPNSNQPAPDHSTIKVLVVDDHPVFRHGICTLIDGQPGFQVCGEAGEAQAALAAFRRLSPDLVVMDITLPGADGIELTKMMVAEQPHAAVLSFSMHEESLYALRALRAGAKGYIKKDEPATTLLAAMRRVAQDEIYVSRRLSERLIFKAIHADGQDAESPLYRLSDRELEVFRWIGKGLGTREIAETLNLSVKTVETHRAHIKEKLSFKHANEMVRFAHEWHTQQQETPSTAPSEDGKAPTHAPADDTAVAGTKHPVLPSPDAALRRETGRPLNREARQGHDVELV